MKFSKEFIKDLNDYCLDHLEHFECFPVEFEWQGEVYKFEDYISHSDTKEGLISKSYHIVRGWNIKQKVKLLGKEKGTVLEIGCGTGKLLAKCKEVG